jgi:methylated-DNA-[protein]-cysteine S-methyltransferase
MTAGGDTTVWDVYESPLGPLTIQARSRGLTGLAFPGCTERLDEHRRAPDLLARAVAQLDEYFAGQRRIFDLPLGLDGTQFQQRVWQQLRQIPYGTTTTYTKLAHSVGRPDIVRAVGAAVGRTPIPIIIPCHRVLAADGALTGYRGGIERKRALLDLERRIADGQQPSPLWAFRQLPLR